MHENCKYRHVSGFKDNYVCIAQQAGLLCCCDDAGGKKKGAVGLQPVQDSICEFHSHKQRTSSDQGKKTLRFRSRISPVAKGGYWGSGGTGSVSQKMESTWSRSHRARSKQMPRSGNGWGSEQRKAAAHSTARNVLIYVGVQLHFPIQSRIGTPDNQAKRRKVCENF